MCLYLSVLSVCLSVCVSVCLWVGACGWVSVCGCVEKMILGNKCDMEDKRVVTKDQGQKVCVCVSVWGVCLSVCLSVCLCACGWVSVGLCVPVGGCLWVCRKDDPGQ